MLFSNSQRKWDFMDPDRDGGIRPEKLENSTKRGMVMPSIWDFFPELQTFIYAA